MENQADWLKWEKELLGIYLSAHPLKGLDKLLPPDKIAINQVTSLKEGQMIKIAGVVQKLHRVITKSGQPMIFATVADEHGSLEVLVFPKILEATGQAWQEEQIVIVTGKVTDKDGSPKIICESVIKLNPPPPANFPPKQALPTDRQLTIQLKESETQKIINSLKSLLEKYPGSCPVYLKLNGQTIKAGQGVLIGRDFLKLLDDLLQNGLNGQYWVN